MCFSPTISYAAGGLLIASGGWSFGRAAETRLYRLYPLALVPVGFGLQQVFEGAVWTRLLESHSAKAMSLGFLLFSHFLWPVWVPFALAVLEPPGRRKRLLGGLTVFGLLLGAAMYLPIAWNGGAEVSIVGSSLVYHTERIDPQSVPHNFLQGLYALTVIIAPLLASDDKVKWLGILLGASLLLAQLIFAWAVISVWCFFAAILSGYICYLVECYRRDAPR